MQALCCRVHVHLQRFEIESKGAFQAGSHMSTAFLLQISFQM